MLARSTTYRLDQYGDIASGPKRGSHPLTIGLGRGSLARVALATSSCCRLQQQGHSVEQLLPEGAI